MAVEYPLQRSIGPRRGSRWVGRTRIRLAEMIDSKLTDAGYQVRVAPDHLWPNQGYWRIDHRADVMPWGGQVSVQVAGKDQTFTVESWDTMTDLIRGFTFEVNGWRVELFADKPRAHPALLRAKATP